MSKHKNKKARRKANETRMTEAEVVAFKTGYDDPELARQAMNTSFSKPQKKKREKLKHGIRYGDGQCETGHRIVTGNADRATGVFDGVLKQKDSQKGLRYIYGVEMGRITRTNGDTGRKITPFHNETKGR